MLWIIGDFLPQADLPDVFGFELLNVNVLITPVKVQTELVPVEAVLASLVSMHVLELENRLEGYLGPQQEPEGEDLLQKPVRLFVVDLHFIHHFGDIALDSSDIELDKQYYLFSPR